MSQTPPHEPGSPSATDVPSGSTGPSLLHRLRREWTALLAVLLTLATALYYYPRLPKEVPSHWGLSAEPDAYSGRGWVAFFPVVLSAALTVIFMTLPAIEPRRGRVLASWRAYRWTRGGVLLFLWWVQLLSLKAALTADQHIDLSGLLGGLGVLFFILGVAMAELPSNFFIGVRTPWTLSSERAWQQTHALARWLFMVAGALIAALSQLLPSAPLALALGLILGVTVLIPVVYSYVVWKQER